MLRRYDAPQGLGIGDLPGLAALVRTFTAGGVRVTLAMVDMLIIAALRVGDDREVGEAPAVRSSSDRGIAAIRAGAHSQTSECRSRSARVSSASRGVLPSALVS